MRSLLLALATLALCACASSRPAARPSGLSTRSQRLSSEGEGSRSPLQFQVKRYPGGESFDIASERGSVVMLDVWATWCEPCRAALPSFDTLARQYSAQGLKVYALSVDEDPRAIAPFLAETKVSLPVLLDVNAAVAESVLKVRGIPTTLLLDRQGRVRYVHESFVEARLGQYRSEIEELLAEPAR
jgi:thiol-disulfide isomerase/thioredoxin